ncbi:MAG: extracellular solute-binding protein [Clostridiales bacterium]|nr:extracellular solute-binding protein [Clostridiales bacterium]
MRKGLFPVMILTALFLCGFAASGEALSYQEVMAFRQDEAYATQDITVPIAEYTVQGTTIEETRINCEFALRWGNGEDGSVTFSVDVPEAGLYQISVRYAQLDAHSGQIERGLLINDEAQFEECGNFLFVKRFADTQYPFSKNEYGNDVMPSQEGLFGFSDVTLRDRYAFYEEPLLFAFRRGVNTLTFTGIKGGLALAGITLKAPAAAPAYAEYSADRKPSEDSSLITVEAEQVSERSSKSINLATVSEPVVTPIEAGHKLLNTLGGDNWRTAGDYAQWEFTAGEAGWYRLAFHYKQSFNTSMTSFRRVEIDGELPFQELNCAAFPFGASWQQKVLGDGEPYLIYLTAGVHTLRLTSVNAPYREVFARLSAVVGDLKALDLSVKEIIGTDSDIYRIWKLEKYIPTIAGDLAGMTEEMKAILADMGGILGGTGELGSLTAAVNDLNNLAENHNNIAKNTDALSDIYTVFADLMDSVCSQPLLLDKMVFVPEHTDIPNPGIGFFARTGFWLENFFSSFFNAGETLSVQEDEEAVTVWVQRSRDYVDMMQLLADQLYTPETGIKVKVSYCPAGSQVLVLANASGEQPDVVTGVDITLPFEFGIRNSLVDLSRLEGFSELVSHVPQGSRIPYYFSGAEYAIAEEVKVKVMFYRTDVLAKLGIKLPTTWDEAMQALSTLLQSNYAIFYPYGDYLTFFFQNGVEVYTPDGTDLAFTNETGFAAFKQWTDLYLKYGLQAEMASFYQHFRTGDVPLGLADIDQYIQFDMAAPDISGQWAIAMVPGTYDADGVLKRWQAGTQTGAVIFKTTEEREDRAWDFLKWWLSTDTQILFADDMESYYGEEFRWFSANLDVIETQAWPEDARDVLLEQMSWYKQLPMVPGGSYMTSRELWNAWTRIVIDKENYRAEIEEAVEDITLELSIKQREMGYIDENGNVLIPMDWMDIGSPATEGE